MRTKTAGTRANPANLSIAADSTTAHSKTVNVANTAPNQDIFTSKFAARRATLRKLNTISNTTTGTITRKTLSTAKAAGKTLHGWQSGRTLHFREQQRD